MERLPTLKELQDRLVYDPETGVFCWKPLAGKPAWNARFAGKPVLSKSRYSRIIMKRKNLLAHRVAWVFITGSYPTGEIDHINGDNHDNRACNLRDVPDKVNKRNLPIRASNKSGVCGVYQIKTTGKWCAQIRDNDGNNLHLGVFSTLQEAAFTRKEAERRFGFHPNHGRVGIAQIETRQNKD